MKFKKNQDLKGKVIDLNSQGMGVVKIDNFPFFVDGTIIGEEVEFRIAQLRKNFAYGKLTKIIEESPHRIEPRDDIGRQVGTMTLQHMDYQAQLEYKKNLVEETFKRIGKFENPKILEIKGMENPWEYRNKNQVPVRKINGQLETGFFRRGSHDLVAFENFHIQPKSMDEAIIKVRDILRKYGIKAYDEENHKGLIRNIIVREGYYTGELMIILVSRDRKIAHLDQIVEEIVKALPSLKSLSLNIQDKKSNVIMGKNTEILYGADYYVDKILGLEFKISPRSFFQVNTTMAEELYKIALEKADLKGTETVLDAYCGIGTISLNLAKEANKVYAMEVIPEAIEMAKINADLNEIDNVHFQVGKAEEVLPAWEKEGIKFDVAVVDPPRKGLEKSFIEDLAKLGPEKIVYVSCNPSTQARDCKLFSELGYELIEISPVDMFPQTPHVESVALMCKLDVDK